MWDLSGSEVLDNTGQVVWILFIYSFTVYIQEQVHICIICVEESFEAVLLWCSCGLKNPIDMMVRTYQLNFHFGVNFSFKQV